MVDKWLVGKVTGIKPLFSESSKLFNYSVILLRKMKKAGLTRIFNIIFAAY